MKKVRSIINIVLGTIIAALGLTGCESQNEVFVKYGSPYADTTVHLMYGVVYPDSIPMQPEAPQFAPKADDDTEN